MRRFGKIILLVLCFALLASAVSLASAKHSGHISVWTENTDHVRTFKFDFGEPVIINWDNPSGGSVDIKVFYQDFTVVGKWEDLPASGEVEFQPSSNGFYLILCKGECVFQFAVGLFLVVPESPLGSLMALGTCFGVFGVFKIVKLRRPRS